MNFVDIIAVKTVNFTVNLIILKYPKDIFICIIFSHSYRPIGQHLRPHRYGCGRPIRAYNIYQPIYWSSCYMFLVDIQNVYLNKYVIRFKSADNIRLPMCWSSYSWYLPFEYNICSSSHCTAREITFMWHISCQYVYSHQIQDPEKCDQMYESLARINTNIYKQRVSTEYVDIFCVLL